MFIPMYAILTINNLRQSQQRQKRAGIKSSRFICNFFSALVMDSLFGKEKHCFWLEAFLNRIV